MAFNYYKTPYGYFTVIVDNIIYAAAQSYGSSGISVYNNGALTAAGNELKALFGTSNIHTTLLAGVGAALQGSGYSAMHAIFENTIDAPIQATGSEQTEQVSVNNTKNFTIKKRYIDNDPTQLTISEQFGFLPYAYSYSRNGDLNGIRSYIYIFNEALSACYTLNLFTYGISPYKNIMASCSSITGSDLTNLKNFLNGITPVDITSDPYADVGDSTTGGGDGTFDGSSDPVPVPSLPSVGATDTGFISLFVPSQAQLKQVASYLWSNFFDLATFKKIFEDPMDCILGLSVVPVAVPTSGNAQITVGNVELSGITLPLASQQYVELDCGTITFDRYFGSYLDFEPYTKMSLFVPYSGVHSVSADDIMGKTVGLKYHIDILTGSLVAFLTCGDSVLYEFNGACASNIPVNSMNYASTIENAIRIAVNIGTTVATAGAAAPATGAIEAGKVAAGGAGIGRGIAIAGSTAEGALSLKPSIDRAGSLGGTTGLMGNQIPYFIITRPRMCKPKNQDFFQGYPSFIQTVLGDMEGTGFTAFENVILAETYLTETEKTELASILSAGVYL